MDIDVQKATGSFGLFFVLKLIHNSYANITNIGPHSLLSFSPLSLFSFMTQSSMSQ